MDKGKQIIIASTSVTLEERLDEPSPKRQKLMKSQGPHIEEYSPTQSPLWIGEKEFLEEQIEQLGSQGGIFIT